jgi:hypothetical protein
MAADTIPDDVRTFVLKYIDAISEIEALLLLRRESMLLWSAASVAERLYVSDVVAAEVLERLLAHGFIARQGGDYRYECATPELAALVDRTADVYARQLIPMTNLIHSKSARIRQFANAFKFRKDT